MRDDFSGSTGGTEITLLTDLRTAIGLHKPYEIVRRNQIAHVRAVRHNQQFAMGIRLSLETADRLRQPFPAVSGQAQARHQGEIRETKAARSPQELQE